MRIKIIAIALVALSTSSNAQTLSTNETILRNAINRLATTKLNRADSNTAYISLHYFNTHSSLDTKWDGNAVGLNAVSGRTSLGLGTISLLDSTEFKARLAATYITPAALVPYALTSSIPTSLPASDVYPWAKAATKPTYTASEVGAITPSAARDTVLNNGIGVNGTAGQDAYFVTADSLGSRARIDTVYLHAGKFKTINDSIAALRSDIGSGTGGGTTVTSWSSAFTGADVADTLTWPGMHTYDIVTVSGVSSASIDTASIYPLSAWLDTNRVIVSRKYGNESGQKYNIMRVPGAMAGPTQVVATGITGAVRVTWINPVSSLTASANSHDSTIITWSTSGYVTPSQAGANKRYALKTATVDTIPSLTADTTYYVSVYAQSHADELSAASQDTGKVLASSGSAGIALVDTSHRVGSYAASNALTKTLTANANGCLIVTVLQIAATTDSVRCGTTKLTRLDSVYSETKRIYYYYLLNPPSGSQTITAYYSGSCGNSIYVANFSGVHQSTPFGTVGKGTAGTGTSVTATVTLASGDYGFGAAMAYENATISVASPATMIKSQAASGIGFGIAGATQTGSAPFAWTLSAASSQLAIAVPIRPAP